MPDDTLTAAYKGKVVAITGAGSGIGQALAGMLAGMGARLALSDIDTDGLAATAALVDEQGATVTTHTVDVADRDAVFAWADDVVAAHQRVNVIVNNAGVGLVANVEEMAIADFEWLMNINFWGVVHGTQAFLRHLQASGDGHVVNISSVFGLTAIPSQSAYNAAKFAVRGFTDALRIELDATPCGVSATTVHPGGVRTAIAANARFASGFDREAEVARFDQMARSTPDQAALAILVGVARNRRRVLVGPDAVVFDAVSRLPAAIPQRLLTLLARKR